MALQKQTITLKFSGLNTKVDPKGAPTGTLSQLENAQAVRRTTGGVELRKRNGFTALTRNIQGSSFIAKGVMGVAYYDEIVLCDGLKSYSYSSTLAKWIDKGKSQTIAAEITKIIGSEAAIPTGATIPLKPNVDVAYQDGYSCYVDSPDGLVGDDASRPPRIYVRDETTGEIIFVTSIGLSYRMRVLGIGNAFFIFSWNGTAKIQCHRILTSDPTTLSAAVDVATNVHGSGIWDVTADVTNTKMWVAYRNTTPTLTIKVWTTGNAAGASSTYAGVNPSDSIGFLNWDFSNAQGYVGVGNTLAVGANPVEARLITFNASDGSVSANTLMEATTAGGTNSAMTGYRNSGTLNVQWSRNVGGIPGHLNSTRAWTDNGGATLFTLAWSVGLASRAFIVGAKAYVAVAYQSDPWNVADLPIKQRRLELLEMDIGMNGMNGAASWAGHLMSIDAAGMPISPSFLPSVPMPTATTAILAVPGLLDVPVTTATVSTAHYSVNSIALDFNGTGLGKPTVYNSVLHIPGAAHKTYDGRDVVEAGFYVDPEAPDALNAATAGGSLTSSTTYAYCLTWSRTDAKGRLYRSNPGAISLVSLDASDNQVTGQVNPLRVTDGDPKFNTNGEVAKPRIELWRTEGDGPNFYLNQVFDNDATVSVINFTDILSDADLRAGEILYTTGGELPNQKPPAVKVLQVHQSRLFALTGDGSTWHTKESAEGFGAEFSSALRFLTDDAGGRPVSLGSLDASLLLFKRNRTYIVQGNGPDDKGVGAYPPPQPLSADIGLLYPNAWVVTPDGVVLQSAKGIFLLSRALDFQPVEGTETWASLAISGTASLDDRSMAVFATTDRMLVRDWQLGYWSTWTGAGSFLSGVATFRWRNQLCVLQSDGTVKREIVGQFFDGTSTQIDMRAELTWVNVGNARVYEALVRGEVLSSCTLAGTFYYDLDVNDNGSKSIALTTGSKIPSVFRPNRGHIESLRLLLHEISTTEGLRLTSVDLVVGIRPGPPKHRSTQFAT